MQHVKRVDKEGVHDNESGTMVGVIKVEVESKGLVSWALPLSVELLCSQLRICGTI